MRQNHAFGLTIWYIASISRRFVCNYWTCLNWWCNVYGYFELFIKHILLINQRISQLVPGMPHILPMLQHWVPWIFKMYLKKNIFTLSIMATWSGSWPVLYKYYKHYMYASALLNGFEKNHCNITNMSLKHESFSQIAARWR